MTGKSSLTYSVFFIGALALVSASLCYPATAQIVQKPKSQKGAIVIPQYIKTIDEKKSVKKKKRRPKAVKRY